MNHTDFFAALKAGQVAGLYLFQGAEEHVKRSALERLRAQVLPNGLETLCESVLDNPTADDLIAAAETLPMMGGRRLVVVWDSALLMAGRAKDEAADSARLVDYLPTLPSDTTVVFYCRGVVDGRKKLSSALGKLAVCVRFDPLDDQELGRWVRGTLKGYGKAITPAVVQKLAFTAGRDLSALAGELAKLADYLGPRTEVTGEDIDTVVTRSLECTVFQLVDALVEGRQTEAFELLAYMLDRGEMRLGILAMVLRQYRTLLMLKLMQAERVPQGQWAQRVGIPPFAVNRALRQAQAYTLAEVQAAVALCVDTDYAVKSGRLREEMALDRAMLMLGRPARTED
ncbi:MAG: DNA polymerase III subunit delta [Oscillospiraceae bacterium]|jgi:DNA polymerase-3 subunit delta|nr:DNA polymerase III subunit delta [Oscillospiraceae bacterium]